MKWKPLLSLVLFLYLASTSEAHDYWLQPDSYYPKLLDTVSVRLLVGDGFVSDQERPFQKKLTLRFQQVNSTTTIDLSALATQGEKPVAKLKLEKPGSHFLVMDRLPAYITLEAKKFNHYLEEEGLHTILAERKKTNEADKPGREKYTRHLKCFLQVGEVLDDVWQKSFQQPLEILPLANPATLKVGDMLQVKIIFQRKKLPAAPLFAYSQNEGKIHKQSLHTNPEGIAAVRLTHSGHWLVRLVHMRRCHTDPKADWESYWAALSFGIK